jgi:hypothetical protein
MYSEAPNAYRVSKQYVKNREVWAAWAPIGSNQWEPVEYTHTRDQAIQACYKYYKKNQKAQVTELEKVREILK